MVNVGLVCYVAPTYTAKARPALYISVSAGFTLQHSVSAGFTLHQF
jgi:hypothetical protein